MTSEHVTTDRVVLKWTVPVDDEWHPVGAGPVTHVECIESPTTVQVWTLEPVREDLRKTRHARVYGTGNPLPPRGELIGSATYPMSMYQTVAVWHVVRSYLEPLEGMI